MSNVIQIKRGPGKPENGVLAEYEIGYSTELERFYLGQKDDSVKEVNYLPAKFIDSNNPGKTTNNGSGQSFRVDCKTRFYGPSTTSNPGAIAVDLAGKLVVKKYTESRKGSIVVANEGLIDISSEGTLRVRSGATFVTESGANCSLYQPTIKAKESSTNKEYSYGLFTSGPYLRIYFDDAVVNEAPQNTPDRGGLVGGDFYTDKTDKKTKWSGANLGAPWLPWQSINVYEINPTYQTSSGLIQRPVIVHNGLTLDGTLILSNTSNCMYGTAAQAPTNPAKGQLYFVEAV